MQWLKGWQLLPASFPHDNQLVELIVIVIVIVIIAVQAAAGGCNA